MCARLCKTTSQGQDLSARSTHPIHHVEEQRHLMDHIIPEVFKIKGPICRWKVCKGDVNSVGYIRQSICWMTNDGRLAQTLVDQRDGGSGEWIREASFAGGLDRSGAIHPPNLVTAVLKVIKRNVLVNKSSQLSNSSLAVPLQNFLSSGTILTTRERDKP